MEKLWCAGQMLENGMWNFLGVYISKDLAVQNCMYDDDFIFSVYLNAKPPKPPKEMQDFCYPLKDK